MIEFEQDQAAEDESPLTSNEELPLEVEQGIGIPDDESYLRGAVEALIFASPEPLTDNQLVAALGNKVKNRLDQIVSELNYEYQRDGRAFEILPVAGGYQFFTRRDYSGVLRKMSAVRARTRLSRAALETLAVVAYRGPVTRAEIDEIRGVDCGGVLRTLLDRRLVAVKGRANVLGRPLLYETTPGFLKHFGLSDLSDLPRDSELLREWGQPRSIEEPAVEQNAGDESQIDLNLAEGKDKDRVMEEPIPESVPEKDANP
ncbi:SMC-Scp complex subunit ScpB [candidate division KSB1 bacterium]|nr:MAG: SMC-Scp complex subunit ScpB [candidate division KSB1 bacterium]